MIDFTLNLVNGGKEGKVKHIVKLFHIRSDANDEPQINITRLHRQAEKIIEESGKITYLLFQDVISSFVNQFISNKYSPIDAY
jgi:hypothetical protein